MLVAELQELEEVKNLLAKGQQVGVLLVETLAEADTALYQAKFWGRAKCVIAGNGNAARMTTSNVAAASVECWDADAA